MVIFRKHKETNYTTIDNGILKNSRLTLKSKGLLCTMLGLPDNWKFTEEGLTALSNDSRSGIRTAIHELEEAGYLIRTRTRNEKGQMIDTQYDVYETPMYQKPTLVKPTLEIVHNKIINNKEINNKELKKESIKEKRAIDNPYIKLTESQYEKLINDYTKETVDQMISYVEEYVSITKNKNKYKDWNLVIRKAIRENWGGRKTKKVESEEEWETRLEREIRENDLKRN